jgi:hypothetical protein
MMALMMAGFIYLNMSGRIDLAKIVPIKKLYKEKTKSFNNKKKVYR